MKKIVFASLLVLLLITPVLSFADESSIVFDNPLGSTNTVQGLVSNVISALEAVVVSLSIVFIVIGGIMYMTSFGNDQAMERAKKMVTASLIGLAIVLSARTFLQEIWNILGIGSGSGIASPGGLPLSVIVARVLSFLLSIVGILAMISLVVGGSMYLTAYGDEKRMEQGKKVAIGSVIGLVIALAALLVVRQVINLIQ